MQKEASWSLFLYSRAFPIFIYRHINHSIEAITAMQAVANFFVQESRLNSNLFENEANLMKILLYNDVATGPEGDSYRAFSFPPWKSEGN